VIAVVPSEGLRALAARSDVQAVDAAPLMRPLLEKNASAIGAPTWWNSGHTGGTGSTDASPIDVGGEVVDPTHPAFQDVTVDNWSLGDPRESGGHGTHTGGIIASNQVYRETHYKGVAYGIDRLVGGQSGYALGFSFGPGFPGAIDPVEVYSNSSGCQNSEGLICQDQTNLIPPAFNVSWAQSAGNNGPNPRSIEEANRNALIVGAINTHDTVEPSDDEVAQFSARGPTVSAVKQPDIVAPGNAIMSPNVNWDRTFAEVTADGGSGGCNFPPKDADGTCDDFSEFSGTSASAPMAGGALALLAGAGIGDEKVQRAILINSARPLTGESQEGWDPDSGWGSLDLTRAYAERANYSVSAVKGGEAQLLRANVPADTKMTLVWDARGVVNEFGSAQAYYTLTNLDLHQYRADGSEIAPRQDPGHGGGPDALDSNDLVEQVRSPAGEGTQQITYKVKAASTVEGMGAEPFAFAAGAPLTDVKEPEVKPVDVAETIEPSVCGEPVTITTKLQNSSTDFDASQAEVSLTVPSGANLVSGGPTQTVAGGTLAKSATSESHSWSVSLDSPGTKTLTIVGEGGAVGGGAATDGETWHYSQDVELSCDAPASLDFQSLSASPTDDFCGKDIQLSAVLRNGSETFDAASSRVTLSTPSGVAIVAGASTQTLSDGVLAPGESAGPQTWTLRAASPGTYALTLTSSATTHAGSTHSHVTTRQDQIEISCHPRDPAELSIAGPGLSSGKLVGAGQIENVNSGRVTVIARWIKSIPGQRDRTGLRKVSGGADLKAFGFFKRSLRICRAGYWRLSASFAGNAEVAPATVTNRILRRAQLRDLRC
jgi:hypothetical protein